MRKWYTMKAKDDDKTHAEILIYDEIGKSWWGEDTVSAKQFNADLKALGALKTIALRINSPGGDVFDGIAIHNTVKNHAATVTAYVDGLAASAASYIAMAADKIVMPENSFLLVHGASGYSMGNADDMRAVADDLERIDKSLTATYSARSTKSEAKVKALMKEDRLMDATEALDYGLCDEVSKPIKMAAKFSLRLLPKAAAERFKAVAKIKSEAEPEPPSVEASEEPEEQPELSPAPPAAAAAEPPTGKGATVVQLNAARNEGMKAHAKYVADVTDLCTLAGRPDLTLGYIKDSMSVERVRADLIKTRAEGDPNLVHQHPMATGNAHKGAWKGITDKLNARVK
jgi:ATP-dependent Clp protease protease subunit